MADKDRSQTVEEVADETTRDNSNTSRPEAEVGSLHSFLPGRSQYAPESYLTPREAENDSRNLMLMNIRQMQTSIRNEIVRSYEPSLVSPTRHVRSYRDEGMYMSSRGLAQSSANASQARVGGLYPFPPSETQSFADARRDDTVRCINYTSHHTADEHADTAIDLSPRRPLRNFADVSNDPPVCVYDPSSHRTLHSLVDAHGETSRSVSYSSPLIPAPSFAGVGDDESETITYASHTSSHAHSLFDPSDDTPQPIDYSSPRKSAGSSVDDSDERREEPFPPPFLLGRKDPDVREERRGQIYVSPPEFAHSSGEGGFEPTFRLPYRPARIGSGGRRGQTYIWQPPPRTPHSVRGVRYGPVLPSLSQRACNFIEQLCRPSDSPSSPAPSSRDNRSAPAKRSPSRRGGRRGQRGRAQTSSSASSAPGSSDDGLATAYQSPSRRGSRRGQRGRAQTSSSASSASGSSDVGLATAYQSPSRTAPSLPDASQQRDELAFASLQPHTPKKSLAEASDEKSLVNLGSSLEGTQKTPDTSPFGARHKMSPIVDGPTMGTKRRRADGDEAICSEEADLQRTLGTEDQLSYPLVRSLLGLRMLFAAASATVTSSNEDAPLSLSVASPHRQASGTHSDVDHAAFASLADISHDAASQGQSAVLSVEVAQDTPLDRDFYWRFGRMGRRGRLPRQSATATFPNPDAAPNSALEQLPLGVSFLQEDEAAFLPVDPHSTLTFSDTDRAGSQATGFAAATSQQPPVPHDQTQELISSTLRSQAVNGAAAMSQSRRRRRWTAPVSPNDLQAGSQSKSESQAEQCATAEPPRSSQGSLPQNKDDEYRKMRRKNKEAAKRLRKKRRQRMALLYARLAFLEREIPRLRAENAYYIRRAAELLLARLRKSSDKDGDKK